MIGKQFIDLFFRVETKKAKKDIDDVGDGLKSVGTSGKIAQGGLNLMSKGFKAVGMAMKAAGIGLVIGLLSQLTGVFQSNQKVADTFGRIMLKLKPVFDAVGDVIAFTAGVLEELIDLFTGAIHWIGKLIGVTDGASSSTTALADEIIHLRNEQKLMNAELALTQLQYQREAELQRQIRDDTSKTMEERIAANEELGKILEEQGQVEREMALVGLQLAQKELSLDRDNIDLQVALTEAKTKLAEIDERITGQRSEQIVNLTSLEKERADKQKEYSERIQKELEEEQKAYDDILKKMRQHIEVAKEELTLTEKLEEAENAFIEAKEHLATLKDTDTTVNEKQIEQSNKIIKQKKLESQALQEKINKMIAEDEALAEFEDAHEEQKAAVLSIYDDLYSGLTETGKEYHNDLKIRQKLENAENLEDLYLVVDEIEFMRKDFLGLKGKLTDDARFTEDELAKDLEVLKKYNGEFITYYDSLEKQTQHRHTSIIKASQAILERKKEQIDEEIKQIEEQNGIIVTKDEELKKKIEDAELIFNEAQKELIAQNLAAVLEFRKTEQEKEVDAVTKKYDDIIAKTLEGSNHEIELTEEKNKKIQEINDRYDDEARQKTRSFLQQQFNLVKTINQKEIDLEEKKEQVKQQILQKAIGISTQGSALYKALAIANTIIATKQGIMQTFGDKDLPMSLKVASAIAIGLEGVKSLNEIRKTKIPGQSGGGGGDLSDIGSFGDVSGDTPSLPGGALGDSDSPPLQAFVVESDISNAQALQNDIDIQATL